LDSRPFVILEPSGASYATVPLPDGFLERLRAIEAKDLIAGKRPEYQILRFAPG